jgi:DNA helicase-2/ATP-dependent DNA helicase PcrA
VNDLSTEQRRILAKSIQLVEACPGAGKTRAVIERFKQSAKAHSRKGVALVSFTNIASDTAVSRCLDEPSLFKPPHFIGTFDTFVHRYILTPVLAASLGKAPTYLSSWSDLQHDNQYIQGARGYSGQGISIDNFVKRVGGQVVLNEEGLGDGDKRYLNNMRSASVSDYNALLARCITKINQHNERGVYDSDTARHKALSLLESGVIGAKLALRFSEVIVDEFQDCSDIEHAILAKLKEAGIHILAVADADQAIFEFRNASPQAYQDFRATLDQREIIQFKDNYRSSQPICDLISSLRPSTDIRIESKLSIEDAATCAPSVYILSANRREDARNKAIALMQEQDLSIDDLMVLGRVKSDAKSLAGDKSRKTQSAKLVVRILMALHIIKDGSIGSREKMKLLRSVEKTLLELFAWPAEVDTTSTEAMYEAIGKSPLWTRRIVARVGRAKDSLWSSKDDCLQIVRHILDEEYGKIDMRLVSTINRRTQLTQDDWDKCREHFNETTGGGALRWSSIHGVKGAEYPGVLIYAPSENALRSWSNSTNTEERRIFYVAASRAQKILMIHIQRTREAELTSAFTTSGIPYVLTRC